jgi:hypothetical protein
MWQHMFSMPVMCTVWRRELDPTILLMVGVVSNHRGWGSVSGQVLWDCWWTKWPCERFISKY